MALWDSAQGRTRPAYRYPWLVEAFSALDARMRRRQAVFEYTRNPRCIFRLDIGCAPRALVLRDGTRVDAGQRIVRLHFWNEQIPRVPKHGPTIGWAGRMQGAIALSLHELAHYLAARPDLDDATVIRGDVPSGTRAQKQQLARIMAHYGFETVAEPERLPLGQSLHRFGENILISLIVLAFNADAFRFDTLRRIRLPIFLSRRMLESRFGRL